ncbi:polysaccharide deacetylase family protein [Prochlorococcus sp. AH-736-E15]|nr:polysaccharide deacetylase family protein [Prochlorococcus sp. AH-736-E15]
MHLKVIMYHYIRDKKSNQYPKLKFLDLDNFVKQLDYLESKYTIISPKEVLDIKSLKIKSPENPLLLTFDDGYKDHLEVANILYKRGLTGLFFPVISVLEDNIVLDVNKIHHILAIAKSIEELNFELNEILSTKYKFSSQQINELNYYYSKANRWDDFNVNYFKRLLQHVLPNKCRTSILNYFFKKYINLDLKDFSKELYLNKYEIENMIGKGMDFGSHGTNHIWLNKVANSIQEDDILNSHKKMKSFNMKNNNFYFCYPYGAYNKNTLKILKKLKCSLAFTVEPKSFDIRLDNHLLVSRFDANDILLT